MPILTHQMEFLWCHSSVLKVCRQSRKALFSWQCRTIVPFYACKVALSQGAHWVFFFIYLYFVSLYELDCTKQEETRWGSVTAIKWHRAIFLSRIPGIFSLAACVVWVKIVVFLLVNALSWIQMVNTGGDTICCLPTTTVSVVNTDSAFSSLFTD